MDFFVAEAEKNGYIELSRAISEKKQLKAGDCVYSVWMNKSMVLFRIGEKPFEEGINILGAHIDSPRLDVKQNPVYEDGGLCYLDTHYYGGIKKYQYVTLPLAIHGVVVKKSGETVLVNVGEEEDDPVFFISDLLPHLAQDQMQKKASAFIEGEALDLVIGNKPVVIDHDTKAGKEGKKPSEKDAVTKALMQTISQLYGIEEEDFISPSFRAQMEVADIARTSCTLLVDKEEIGSVGATGMRSRFFENALAEVMQLCGQYSELALRRTLANSAMLSSDVSSAYDPAYASAFEKKNCAYLGGGMVFEYIASLRQIMDQADVLVQTAELGKVDVGGGGTIAYILALYGMNVIDSGVPVLSMHAPWEATSKADIYEAYRGYKAFLKEMDFRNA